MKKEDRLDIFSKSVMETPVLNERINRELERQFPKGDKARGKALVLFAVMQQELDKLVKKIKKLEEK